MKKTLLTLLASGALLTATLGFADTSSHPQGMGMEKPGQQCPCKGMDHKMDWQGKKGMMHDPIAMLGVKLNLTQEQRDAIRADMDKLRPEFQKYQDEWIDSKQHLHQLMKEGKADASEVAKYADMQGDAISHFIQLRFQTKQNLMKVLTPEQQKKFLDMKKDHEHGEKD